MESRLSQITVNIIILVLFNSLCVSHTTSTLLTRWSQGILNEKYILPSSIFLAEVFKLVIASVMVIIVRIRGKKYDFVSLLGMLVQGSLWLLPSALLYSIQNYLMYFCLAHMDAVIFIIVNQLKVFFSALMTILILRRKISLQRWIAIILLFIGIILVKIDDFRHMSSKSPTEDSDDGMAEDVVEDGDDNAFSYWIGLLGAFGSAFCAGLSGVYFELVLKKKKQQQIIVTNGEDSEVIVVNRPLGLWERNFQLYLPSVILCFFSIFILDFKIVVTKGMFWGMSWVSCLCFLNWAVTGILTSLVVKYGSAILTGFGSGFAVIGTAFGAAIVFRELVHISSWCFLLGASIVVVSVTLYQIPILYAYKEIRRCWREVRRRRDNRNFSISSIFDDGEERDELLGDFLDSDDVFEDDMEEEEESHTQQPIQETIEEEKKIILVEDDTKLKTEKKNETV